MFVQEEYPVWAESQKVFLPACLVATSSYADTRKTLVIRWLEGYSRGIRIIQKEPSRAASRLVAFYRETLGLEVSEPSLEKEIHRAFIFEEKKRDEGIIGEPGRPSSMEMFARAMTDYQVQAKAIEAKKGTGRLYSGGRLRPAFQTAERSGGSIAKNPIHYRPGR